MKLARTATGVAVILLASCSADGRQVSRSDFESVGLTWPLKVDRGLIGCTNNEAWFEADGFRYGLNGLASPQRGYSKIESIWAENSKLNQQWLDQTGTMPDPPLRLNIGDMIDKALELCD